MQTHAHEDNMHKIELIATAHDTETVYLPQRQSQYQTTLWTMGEHKLRTRVRVDQSYRKQSYAVIERWSGLAWEEVASVHYDAMESWCRAGHPEFGLDERTLIERARIVLG